MYETTALPTELIQLVTADYPLRRRDTKRRRQCPGRSSRWQRRLDSNQRMSESKSLALPLGYGAVSPQITRCGAGARETRKVGKKGRCRRLWQPTWSERWDSNPRPLDPKSSALPLRYAQIKRTAIQQSSNFGKDRDIGFKLGNQFFILHIEWHLMTLFQPVEIIQYELPESLLGHFGPCRLHAGKQHGNTLWISQTIHLTYPEAKLH